MQKSKREMDDTDFKNSDFGRKNYDLYSKFYSPMAIQDRLCFAPESLIKIILLISFKLNKFV